MFIEAVIVCSGYADFLGHTLPRNLGHFDHVTVVTSHDDGETRKLCAKYSVECRPTDLLSWRGETFAKGRAIDLGLSYLLRKDWVVHLDADIVLPPNTRRTLENLPLDPESIYGIDRVNCPNYEAWQAYASGETHQNYWHWLMTPPPFPLGARLVRSEHNFVPIGFFQLWHGKHDRRYPIRQPSAEHTDFLHAMQWPADKRRLIPELIGVHLESGPARMGANWSGRRTPPFGPAPDRGRQVGTATEVLPVTDGCDHAAGGVPTYGD